MEVADGAAEEHVEPARVGGQQLDEAPLTPAKLTLVANAVMTKCDAIDGLKDGLIDDPRACRFDAARDLVEKEMVFLVMRLQSAASASWHCLITTRVTRWAAASRYARSATRR